jgi:hypothetical protein
LDAYPQYLLHQSIGLHQVVWLKVECSKDGSVKEVDHQSRDDHDGGAVNVTRKR